MKLNELFKNTSYDDTLFSSEAITTIEKGIFTKNINKRERSSLFQMPCSRKRY